jgi:hypothetical protein
MDKLKKEIKIVLMLKKLGKLQKTFVVNKNSTKKNLKKI